jgi:hypothetical protein
MGRLWNALTYFTEELGPNFTMPVTKTNCSALGARPGEGLEGTSLQSLQLCPTKSAESKVLISPNLYYKMGFAMQL